MLLYVRRQTRRWYTLAPSNPYYRNRCTHPCSLCFRLGDAIEIFGIWHIIPFIALQPDRLKDNQSGGYHLGALAHRPAACPLRFLPKTINGLSAVSWPDSGFWRQHCSVRSKTVKLHLKTPSLFFFALLASDYWLTVCYSNVLASFFAIRYRLYGI